jgi:arginyl-tRNA synthetase
VLKAFAGQDMETFKREIAESVARALGSSPADLGAELTYPPKPDMGDLAFPCFPLAKRFRKPPAAVAQDLAAKISPPPFVETVKAQGPYLNFRLRAGELAREVLSIVGERGEKYGSSDAGAGKTVVVDYSSPNIAKHLAFHHIRSTMIGQALCNLHRASGWQVVGINHLGDWGTTFGKLMVAVKQLAEEDFLDRAGLGDLHKKYVAFHEAAKERPALEDEARAWFKRLESDDPEARALWERFRDISLADFDRVYEKLGVRFDHITGESFFNDRLDATVEAVERSGLTRLSEGALVVPFEDDMPPALLRKSDGATLYITRDIAAAIYRQESYGFARALYVTDAGQSLHFRQLFRVLGAMGYPWAAAMEHVPFGVILLEGQRGKTREGNVVLLSDVLDEAVHRTLSLIEEKNPDLEEKEQVAAQVGVGAVVFNDLRNKRVKDVNFRWEDVLNFDGDAGPYVQYAHVRVHGILRKAGTAGEGTPRWDVLGEPEERGLLLLLGRFPETVARAAEQLEPSLVAQYLLEVAAAFHRFHHRHRVIGDDPELTRSRIALVRAVGTVLRNGLGLLCIAAPDKM